MQKHGLNFETLTTMSDGIKELVVESTALSERKDSTGSRILLEQMAKAKKAAGILEELAEALA